MRTDDLVRAMVAQSEQACLAISQGNRPAPPAVQVLEYSAMKAFFVAGDRSTPFTRS